MKNTKNFLLFAFIMLIVSSCGHTEGISEDQSKLAQSHYQMGLSHFSENNVTKALQELIKAYTINPNDGDICHLLGLAYLTKKDYMNAEKYIKEAIDVSGGNFPKARNNLGVVYLEQNRYDEAIAEFDKAANNILYDTPEYAFTNMGWAFYKKGDVVKAKLNYEKAIEVEPRYSLSYFNLGLMYFDLQKYDDAVSKFKEAIKYFPRYLDAWYNLALTYFKMSDLDKAKEAFNKIIEIAPETEKAELSKGYLDLLK